MGRERSTPSQCYPYSIAPTGSISLIASVSSGIEPFFALAFRRYVLDNTELLEINPILEEKLKTYSVPEETWKVILEKGNLEGVDAPEELRRLFITALEIPPSFHIQMQATFQKYVDNAVSKTINLPQNATPRDVEEAYLLAHELKCKGITAYRYGSRPQQVLYLGTEKSCETC